MATASSWDVLSDPSPFGFHTLVNSLPTMNTADLCNPKDFEEMAVCDFQS